MNAGYPVSRRQFLRVVGGTAAAVGVGASIPLPSRTGSGSTPTWWCSEADRSSHSLGTEEQMARFQPVLSDVLRS